MNDLATLPTTRDEDWRYADGDYLASSKPELLNYWRELEVPAGETRVEHGFHHGSEDARGSTDRLRVRIGEGARFESFQIIAGGQYRRVELEVHLEEGAHFEFGGVTIGGGDKVQEFVTRAIHAKPGATSHQVVRAVQWCKATGNFLGRIEVARDAQKTDAAQDFKALLLERGATANAKPELEIFADDVQCAHGAAIGQLDEMAAYYMAARGLDPATARKLLVQGFIGDAFIGLADDATREGMMEKALEALDEAML